MMGIRNRFPFWESDSGGEAEEDESKPYTEELEDIWEEAKEIDDPMERVNFIEEKLKNRQRTLKSEAIVNAAAADLGKELRDRNA